MHHHQKLADSTSSPPPSLPGGSFGRPFKVLRKVAVSCSISQTHQQELYFHYSFSQNKTLTKENLQVCLLNVFVIFLSLITLIKLMFFYFLLLPNIVCSFHLKGTGHMCEVRKCFHDTTYLYLNTSEKQPHEIIKSVCQI